jgi:putative hemolysin
MDDASRLSLIVVILLILCAAYFAVAETSFASVSKVRIKIRAERGEAKAIRALKVLDNFDLAITSILICTNIVHLSAASIATLAVTRMFPGVSGAVTISTFVMTLVVFFAGEMLPKSIAKKYSERLSLAVAGSLWFFMTVLKPLATLLTAIGNFAAKLAKADPQISVTEDEIYDIIEDMTEEGSLDEERGELISSALQFAETTVESILTSRVDIVALDIDDPVDEMLGTIRSETHSRLPVYEGSIDNIIGILSIRKFIKTYLREGEKMDVRALLDEPYFIHGSTNIDGLLPVMSKKRLNMAVVTDNYGGTLGIVTVEDILEELVGEIWDEDDVVEEPYVALDNGEWDCTAEMTVSDVFELLELDEDDDDEFTNKLLGEWAYEQFDNIPSVGDSFRYENVEVTVSEMHNNRILRLRVRLIDEGGEEK